MALWVHRVLTDGLSVRARVRVRERVSDKYKHTDTQRDSTFSHRERDVYYTTHNNTNIYNTQSHEATNMQSSGLETGLFTCFDEFNKTLCMSNISPYYIPTNTNFKSKAKRPAYTTNNEIKANTQEGTSLSQETTNTKGDKKINLMNTFKFSDKLYNEVNSWRRKGKNDHDNLTKIFGEERVNKAHKQKSLRPQIGPSYIKVKNKPMRQIVDDERRWIDIGGH